MATELATAYLSLVPSMRGVGASISKEFAPVAASAQASGDAAGKKFGGGFSSGVKGLAATLGGLFVADRMLGFFSDGIAEAREAQKVGALTENVIRATGGAAKITADQVGELSESISKKAGIDDEAIQTGANLLLTFKNIKNEAGEGANIFDRATGAAADLSAAGFGSVDSAAKMLGKALNDPVKGITALGRAGVTFTQGQKDQIAAMAASGDMVGAQKLIMAELESQVGGAAAASATAADHFEVAMGNFKESAGTALIPILDGLAEKGTAAFQWAADNPETVKNLAIAIGAVVASVLAYKAASGAVSFGKDVASSASTLATGISKASGAVGKFSAPGGPLDGLKLRAMLAGDSLKNIGANGASGLSKVGGMFADAGKGAATFAGNMIQAATAAARAGIAAAGAAAKTVAMKAVQLAVAAATGIWTAAQWLLNVALNANPIGLIIVAIVAIIGVIALLWTKCDWFRNGVMAIWDAIKAAVGAVVDWFKATVLPALSKVWEWIKTGVGVLWSAFSAYWGFILNAVRSVVEWVMANLWPKIQTAFNALKAGVQVVWNIVSTNFNLIKDVIGAVLTWVAKHIGEKIAAARAAFDTVKDKIAAVIGWFSGMKDKVANALGGIADKITAPFKSAFNAVARFWNSTVGKLSWSVPDWVPGLGGKSIDAPKLPELADGATVKPRKGGTLAILAEAGRAETVVDTGLMNRRLAEMDVARAALAAPPAPVATMPTVLKVYDADGVLRGQMRVAAEQVLDQLADQLVYRNA